MGLISQHSISNIIIMRNLNLVKQHCILKLCGISHNCALTNDSLAADKCTVAHLGVSANDSRSGDTCSRRNCSGSCDPYIFALLLIFRRIQCFSQLNNEISDLRKNLPRIGFSLKKLCCNGLIQIQHIADSKIFHHDDFFPPCLEARSGFL